MTLSELLYLTFHGTENDVNGPKVEGVFVDLKATKFHVEKPDITIAQARYALGGRAKMSSHGAIYHLCLGDVCGTENHLLT